jgi:5-methylcytosine-specific restriction endonuclease McrA
VLVLNRLWQPVNICSVRRALALLFLGHAQVVGVSAGQRYATHDLDSWINGGSDGEPEDVVVRGVSTCFRVPKIIVLAVFDRLPKKEIKFTRENVFRRDGYTCQYCHVEFEPRELNLDHVVPRDKGGRTTWENVVCSCIRCNTKKANLLPKEAGMFPKQTPRAPRWRPMMGLRREAERHFHESWKVFLEPSST